jgi:hypothetical protein
MARTLPKPAASRKAATRSSAPAVKHAATPAVGARHRAAPIAMPKLVRDRFTLPQADHDRIAALKARMRAIGYPTKKNALLRVGLLMLSALSDDTLRQLLDQLPPAKPPKAPRAIRRSKRAPD